MRKDFLLLAILLFLPSLAWAQSKPTITNEDFGVTSPPPRGNSNEPSSPNNPAAVKPKPPSPPAPAGVIAEGQPIPKFTIPVLDGNGNTYSNSDLRGKVILIDFWATWCGPCVGEMKHLHQTYEKYKGSGFEIMSISLDRNPEAVKLFREGKWKMPWKHGIATGNFQGEIAAKFGVNAIPKPILIDSDGNVLALGGQLRGEFLERAVAKFLGQ